VTTTDCVSVTNKAHRTKETATVVHFTEYRGYLGGTMSERGYRQTTLERTGNDPYLPPSKSETPKNEFEFPDQSADRFWKKGSQYGTFSYGILGNEYKMKLRLPGVNKEVTKPFDKTYRDQTETDERCINTDKVTIKGAVTLQRIQ
jgi:hypothetical protein